MHLYQKLKLATLGFALCGTGLSLAALPRHVPTDFIIQSHRAGGKVGPENTLESCHFAWRLNTIPEVDLRTTADGVMVAFHDQTLDRVVANPPRELSGKGIQELSFDELRQLDVGAYMGEYFVEQQIPSIASIFAAMAGRPERQLYLDIKDVSLEALAALVRQHLVERQVILCSTHYDLIREWKALVPESQTLLWMGGSEAALSQRVGELREADFAGITQLQVHARLEAGSEDRMMPSESFFRELAGELEQRGILFQSLPWTAETWVYAKLLGLGVDSFATDYPQRTREAVGAYYEGLGQ